MLVVYKPSNSNQVKAHLAWLKQQEKVGCNVEWFETSGHFDADREAIYHCAKQHQRVVAVGGDGTLHLVINALAKTRHEIALLPSGTGNDFARQFDYSTEQWRKTVFSNSIREIDLGCINEARYFHNVAGVGFNAAVVSQLNGHKTRHALSYVVTGLKQLLCFKGITVALQRLSARRAMMVLVANGQHFAAGLTPAPHNDLQDGKFTVVGFYGVAWWQRIAAFAAMLVKRHQSLSFVESWQDSNVEIHTPDLLIEADGEIVAITPARFSCEANALRLCVPNLLEDV
ncbi:hypothetical protein PALB_22450 [Pseudoalteromonas luteoviolacea B = ATCC 29581]|nr:hypothetical protein PALB_22450 [Pseudoalteromonas luteoviolacea B = ATCC 29581]